MQRQRVHGAKLYSRPYTLKSTGANVPIDPLESAPIYECDNNIDNNIHLYIFFISLKSKFYAFIYKRLQLLGDFVPEASYRLFAPAPHWGFPSPRTPESTLPQMSSSPNTMDCHFCKLL